VNEAGFKHPFQMWRIMANRPFWSWPAGWRQSLPWGILVGLAAGAALIVAEGFRSGWNFIDWCGTLVVVFFVAVAITALSARSRKRID
jgi:hypothetical protein